MKIWTLLVIFSLFFLLSAQFAYGNDPPTLSSPANSSVTSSTKLSWETPSFPLYPNSPYNVQVDNNQDFSSTEKNYQTKNTSYSPQLNPGLWYWRIRVKDSEGNWTNFSPPWSFTFTDATPKPTSLSTQSIQEEEESNSNSKNLFIISSPPNQIDSNESFDIEVTLELPSNPNSIFFLKGAFKKEGSSNYFGQTLVAESWVKNNKTYSDQIKITTDSSGKFTGKLSIKPDSEDSGFSGTGEYIFKVAKYSSTGSGLSWSNEEKLTITEIKNDTEEEQKTPTPTSPALTSKTKSLSKLVLGTNSATPSSNTPQISPEIPNFSSPSPEEEVGAVLSYTSVNWWFIGGGILFLFLGIAFVVKLIYEKRRPKNFDKF